MIPNTTLYRKSFGYRDIVYDVVALCVALANNTMPYDRHGSEFDSRRDHKEVIILLPFFMLFSKDNYLIIIHIPCFESYALKIYFVILLNLSTFVL